MTAQICCAYLRVYRPLEAFAPAERERIEMGARETAGRAANPLRLIAPEESRDAYTIVSDGRTYACPARTRLRTILGMLDVERTLPDGVGALFFSARELADARRELERIRSLEPDVRPCLVQSAWHVPVRWFVCFDDAERRIVQDGDHPRLSYRTTIGQAKGRVAEALDIVKGGIIHPVMVGMIFDLGEWLATFEDEAIFELDYASVASLFEPEDLADDHSVADVWGAIRALGAGDGMRAALSYRKVTERWASARERQSLN